MIELDSYSETFFARLNCLLMHYTELVGDVMSYYKECIAKKNVLSIQVVMVYAMVYGRRYMLIINEALYIIDLKNSLMCTSQLRHYNIEFHDNPYEIEPMTADKSVENEYLTACLKSKGANIFPDTWTSIDRDLNEHKHIILTYPLAWNPDKL